MKKLVALLGLSLLFVLPSFAQNKQDRFKDHDPQEMVDKMMVKMTEKLDLTEAQQKEIEPLLLAHHQKKMEAHKGEQADRKEMAEKMKEILNPEQFEKFQQHFKKRAKMRKNKGGELPTETPED
ncbi:MAG: hypothetical protein DA405_11700 [Bacteroidetes bacterium]|nr:MAG: hypothetical protein DA405_11700 [Bacteroidota bacterium]